MMNSELVKVIDFWQKTAFEEELFPRSIVDRIDLSSREVIDLVGSRRSGKSSVLKLLMRKLPSKDHFLFINFEDPFFVEHKSPRVIEELIETYLAYFSPKLRYLFFDEIQNIDRWETAIRKLRDGGSYRIFVTGFSSKLLSSELASRMTGRHISHQLWPLSFKEYLMFHGVPILSPKDVLLKGHTLARHFGKYLAVGGFPEIVRTKNLSLLKQYYADIVQRDIVGRHDVRAKEVLEKMGVFLISQSGKTVSIASLKKLYGVSYEAASTFLDYFKETFLVYEVPQFSYSLKTQQKAAKKIYAVDTGLANAVSFRFSEERGRMLENSVFLHLKRIPDYEIYCYRTSTAEVDFVIKRGQRPLQLIQVVWNLDDSEVKRRELKGLEQAFREFSKAEALILTYENEGIEEVAGKKVRVEPVFRWLLSGGDSAGP